MTAPTGEQTRVYMSGPTGEVYTRQLPVSVEAMGAEQASAM
eukprot:CAMPEP_0206488060 /NCGR_PEP_ID=MMETSP0324_2-20121206/42115_1 /ASSEMBLY_ACC=CAM_ASM_000836 /TAXON_ID=2866 /ORGANISM="Crypthecodinium cohnii, Strain Seligo" /LENGTH=40 /DNA_ID= /DNA_START= /DNA_END= /DNA_ORIENTATION=